MECVGQSHVARPSFLTLRNFTSMRDEDMAEILAGHDLSDEHMNAGQALLKEKFGHRIAGFQHTAVSAAPNCIDHYGGGDFIQVLHVGGSHWVLVSNIECAEGQVCVYDSLNRKISSEVAAAICRMVGGMADNIKVNMPESQYQDFSNDCGLFTLAYAYTLCEGFSPRFVGYDQGQMREHLFNCLRNREMTRFPPPQVGTEVEYLHATSFFIKNTVKPQ